MNLQELFETAMGPMDLSLFLYDSSVPGDSKKERGTIRGIEMFTHYGILPNQNSLPACPRCGLQMQASTVNDKSVVNWRFRCHNNHVRAATTNTFLENVRLKQVGAGSYIYGIQSFIEQLPVTKFAEYEKNATDTACAWYKYCRNVGKKIAWHEYIPIGGMGDVVEVDESHLFKRKYNTGRGTRWESIWVLGGISRTTKQVFAVVVAQRNEETLSEHLVDYVDIDSYLCTDGWLGYNGCANLFNGHGVVNHSQNFVNPPRDQDPLWVAPGRFNNECLDRQWTGPPPRNTPNYEPFRIHTQHIERSWQGLKKIIGNMRNVDEINEYIGEWMYRQNVLKNYTSPNTRFSRFMGDIARAYPGMGSVPMHNNLLDCTCRECEG